MERAQTEKRRGGEIPVPAEKVIERRIMDSTLGLSHLLPGPAHPGLISQLITGSISIVADPMEPFLVRTIRIYSTRTVPIPLGTQKAQMESGWTRHDLDRTALT